MKAFFRCAFYAFLLSLTNAMFIFKGTQMVRSVYCLVSTTINLIRCAVCSVLYVEVNFSCEPPVEYVFDGSEAELWRNTRNSRLKVSHSHDAMKSGRAARWCF